MFFPYARYTSVVGVHTTLVAFTALFLPQTSHLLWPPEATTVTDHPQSQFLDAITDSPVITLAWIVVGLVVLQTWWAGWVRQWCFEYTSRGTSDEIKLEKYRFQQGRFAVRLLHKSSYLKFSLVSQKLGRAASFTACVALVFHAIIVLFGAPSAR